MSPKMLHIVGVIGVWSHFLGDSFLVSWAPSIFHNPKMCFEIILLIVTIMLPIYQPGRLSTKIPPKKANWVEING